MVEREQRALVAALGDNETAALQLLDRVGRASLFDDVLGQRITDREQRHDVAFLVVERRQPQLHELAQARAYSYVAAPAPHAVNQLERSRVNGLADDFVKVQRISARHAPQPARARHLDLVAEYRSQQRRDIVATEGLHVDALGGAVAPQRSDRVRDRLQRAQGENEAYAGRNREMVEERSRERIEEMGVVDRDHERAAGGTLVEGAPHRSKQVDRLRGRRGIRG
jgi:hypothetical protein